ncbi:hypothetical protein [Vibrio alfacsensis]|uniref:hypothetical protein n=1 Tax=Vibrio alfacsensis TaxID=1074311 RepID=UPI004068B168
MPRSIREIKPSKVVLSSSEPIISKLMESDSILYEVFKNSKWDEFVNGQSTEEYNVRFNLSKVFICVLNENLPLSINFFSMTSQDIDVYDVYSCYSEIDSILCFHNMHQGVNSLFKFLARNVSNESVKDVINGFYYYGKRKENINDVINLDFIFTLQKIRGKGKKYLPFDSNRLPDLLKRGSLLHECLVASEKTEINYSTAVGFRRELEFISKHECPKVKLLLNSKKNDINDELIINAFIEYESLIENELKYKTSNSFQRSDIFRSFLNRWCGQVAGYSSVNEVGFISRFDRNGNVKCVSEIELKGKDINGEDVYILFFPLINPDFYRNEGLLISSLVTLSKKINEFSLEYLEKLEFIIKFILNNNSILGGNYSFKYFFSNSLSSFNREKVVILFKKLERIIELSSVEDKEEYFNVLYCFLCLNGQKIIDGRSIPDLNYKNKFSIVNHEDVVVFYVKNKVNGVVLTGYYEWDIKDVKRIVKNNGSLVKAIYNLSESSKLNSELRSVINVAHNAVKLIFNSLSEPVVKMENIQRNKDVIKLFNSSPEDLDMNDVLRGFLGIEDILVESDIKGKAKYSQCIRKLISDNNSEIRSRLKMNDCGFKTRFSERNERGDIQLIIPLDDSTGLPIDSPINSPKKPINELKKEISEYYQKPIESILNSVKNEIDLYHRLVNDLSTLVNLNDEGEFTYEVPEELQELVKSNHNVKSNTSANKKKLKSSIEKYGETATLAAFLQVRVKTSVNEEVYCSGKNLIIPSDYFRWFGGSATRMKPFFWAPLILPKQILLMCFIRLVIHTTWNKDVVATLRGKDLPYPLPQRRFFIQGNKAKVGKLTSEVEVLPSDIEVREVIELLTTHYQNMLKLGFNPASVWETPFSKALSFLNQRNLKEFIDHYGLSNFGIEQLAKHQINVRKGIDDSIYKSKLERNHSQLKTTASYVDHPLARIYYEANNADFQRKLEATVTFRHTGADALSEYGFSRSDIDLKLFKKPEDDSDLPYWFLLPDGSTCTDIWAPIDKDSKNQKVCGGRKCHTASGCIHNRVIISTKDFVATLRHQSWFIERCEALLEKHTREYFEEYISPAMRFTFGLVRYVETANPEMFREANQILDMKSEA